MNTPNQVMPVLFLLEDDQYIEEDIREFAKDENWGIIAVQCVEDAISVVKARSCEIAIAIVDMMVPHNREKHGRLRELEKQRANYIQTKFPQMAHVAEMSESELVLTRSELVDIDQQIRDVLDFDGGRTLLKELADTVYTFPVVVFSARLEFSNDEYVQALNEQKRWLGWKPKPIDPSVLAELLNAVRGGGAR